VADGFYFIIWVEIFIFETFEVKNGIVKFLNSSTVRKV
jgi:hypothetical protein